MGEGDTHFAGNGINNILAIKLDKISILINIKFQEERLKCGKKSEMKILKISR